MMRRAIAHLAKHKPEVTDYVASSDTGSQKCTPINWGWGRSESGHLERLRATQI